MKSNSIRGEQLKDRLVANLTLLERVGISSDNIIMRGNNPYTFVSSACYWKNLTKVVFHWTIIGPDRKVEYYPTTNKVYANAVDGKFKAAHGVGLECAIELAGISIVYNNECNGSFEDYIMYSEHL